MKLLLVGSGGREHTLAWTLVRSPQVETLFVAPGNGGTATLAKCQNVEIASDEINALREFALENQIDLTVVGPEATLVAGIVDHFADAGLAIFGPSKAAAQLEGSKAFAKEFLVRHGIPTASAEIFSDYDDATRHLRSLDDPPVIKADGLAAGKGVIIPQTMPEAALILRQILVERRFGDAGATVLVEERLRGPELSMLVFCDGKSGRIMPPAQDYKRLMDGDFGPNTGGMGAFTPSKLATTALQKRVEQEIIAPTLAGMAAEGVPYSGVLYVGLMLTDDGPKVIEFNCRFGDPEAQVILPLLESDLVNVMLACNKGKLEDAAIEWRKAAAVTVVMAAHGYPGEYTKGVEIRGIEKAEEKGCLVFQARTRMHEDRLLTNGGRVVAVTALGSHFASVIGMAYAGVKDIDFGASVYRKDIGQKALKK